MEINQAFGGLLRQLREEKNLGVNQLAKYVGVSGAEISRIERGERQKINPHFLRKLAPKLGVSYHFLMQKAGYLSDSLSEAPSTYNQRTNELIEKVGRLAPNNLDRLEKIVDYLLEEQPQLKPTNPLPFFEDGEVE